jgi:multiple sugar transport system permease protein
MATKQSKTLTIRGDEYELEDIVAAVGRVVGLGVMTLFFVFPVYWVVSRSLMTNLQAFQIPPVWIPTEPTLSAYQSILLQGPYAQFLLNSVIATVLSVTLALVLSVPATYGLVVSDFRYNLDHHLSFFLISLFMLPPIVTSISYFNLLQSLGLYDRAVGLGLIYTMFNIPLIVWFTRGFIADVPESLRESALLEGANEFQVFYRIYLPLIRPGIAAAAIISYIITWNEYLLALILTSNRAKTMPVGINQFVGQYNIAWNELSAGIVLVVIPSVVFLIVTQRYIVSGLVRGAVKE